MMKKLAITAMSILMLASTAAQADTYNNSAYIGKWAAKNNTDENYTELYINYCDSETISLNFKQVTNGVELFDFREYCAKVDDNYAYVNFDYTDEYGTTKPGYIKLSWFVDNIWVSAYSNDNIKFFDNALYPTVDKFNPYVSPYSYNVSINLNSKNQTFDKAPFIVNGTTYVPLRGVLDSMNLNVYWDDYSDGTAHTQMITTARNNTIIQFKRADHGKGYSPWYLSKWINDKTDTANSAASTIDISEHQPIILDGTTYIPLRIISEEYGAAVNWDGSSNTVNITGSVASDTKKSSDEISKIEGYTLTEANKIASGYINMENIDTTPYYTYKSKYYRFTQDNSEYKIHFTNEIE